MVYITEISGIATRQTLIGNKGWQLSGADSVATDMDPPSVEALKSGFASDLHHLLLTAADPKSRVWSLGPQFVDSVRALGVAVEAPAQGTRVYYLDPVTYRLIAFDQGGGQGLLARRKFADFQRVGGILWPYHEERLLSGESVMRLDVRSVRFNTGVPDSAFEKPRADPKRSH